jgi:uncharacterized OsmC-like protein
MERRAKRFEYAIALDADGALRAEGTDRLEPSAAWTPEHLLLAALARCTLASLRFHARRASLAVVSATASADGAVTLPEGEERFRLVEAAVRFDVTLDPRPDRDALARLLERAEHDCFVSASLVPRTATTWVVNGEPADDPA